MLVKDIADYMSHLATFLDIVRQCGTPKIQIAVPGSEVIIRLLEIALVIEYIPHKDSYQVVGIGGHKRQISG